MSLEIISIDTSYDYSSQLSLLEKVFDITLGTEYDLSLAFVTKKQSHKSNLEFRNKDNPTNILSFPLSNTSGEILIDIETCKEQYESFNLTFYNFILFLFIHGCVHLLGFDHGEEMEEKEKSIREKINLSYSQ